MSNLTQIEKALLAEFESLAKTFEHMVAQQSEQSARFLKETQQLNQRQSQLEKRLKQVSEALADQNRLSSALIDKVQHSTSRLR